MSEATSTAPVQKIVSAADDYETDLEKTKKLFAFLQGDIPDGYKIAKSHRPKLTAEQAWTVIWYLGNQYWQVTDFIERCGVCGDLFDREREGECLDFGRAPHHFCDTCSSGELAEKKRRSRLNPDKSR